jgi:hypothetical protein
MYDATLGIFVYIKQPSAPLELMNSSHNLYAANTKVQHDRVNLPATPDQSFVLIRKPVLDENPGGCFASVVGWSAVMYMGLGPNCGVNEITHELGHILGLFHEQQRPDREAYTHFVCSNLKGYPWIPNDLSKNDAV